MAVQHGRQPNKRDKSLLLHYNRLIELTVVNGCLLVTQFWKTIDVRTFFKFHFIKFSLSAKTDEWADQLTAF